jgi:5-oxopent-3-ene-1,2,5-tricarboxylate decarboxylase/2-hydroxyhepta-2,4-diene-1,7-dioate isomerase
VTEIRRILLDGYPTEVIRHGETLVAHDGRTIAIEDAQHLAPVEPTKIIAVHLNYDSRTQEFMTKLPSAPTYFHKPITALNSHKGAVVRPAGCKWLNYEGEIVIVIGKTCRNISPDDARQRFGHPCARRARTRHGLGFPQQVDSHDCQR